MTKEEDALLAKIAAYRNSPAYLEPAQSKATPIPPSWIPRDGNYRSIHRYVVEQCRKIHIPALLKALDYGQHQVQFGTVCLSDRDASYLQIGRYQFGLKRVACRVGGGYWLIKCPVTKRLRWHLFVDPDGNIGTRDSLGLTYIERRMIPRKRQTWNRQKLWVELHGEKAAPDLGWFESHPDAMPRRPKPWIDGAGRYHPRRMQQSRYERALRKLNRTRRQSKP